jgi:hypothetical protein
MFLKRKFPGSAAVLALAITVGCVGDPDSKAYFLSPSGYGPIKFGMSVPEASKLLGVELSPLHELDEDELRCHYVYANSYEDDLAVMVEEGVITRIDVRGSSISTKDGITVGSTGAQISERYRDGLLIKPHKYNGPEGKYYIVSNSSEQKFVFEVIDDRVVVFRSGRYPAVEYVEGCL